MVEAAYGACVGAGGGGDELQPAIVGTALQADCLQVQTGLGVQPVDELVEVSVQVERPRLVDDAAAVGEGEDRGAAAAAVGVAAGLDGEQGAGIAAVQEAGDERLSVLGEPCQQFEVSLDALSARL